MVPILCAASLTPVPIPHPSTSSPALEPSFLVCSYVQEYLAIGEAPEEVRNCFQQRSRWAKGHFQVGAGVWKGGRVSMRVPS